MTGLYIHIPFCASKCSYCDFCSRPPADNSEIVRLVQCLCTEIEDLPAGFEPDTIYIGGGSPSLLDENAWIRIFQTLESRFSKKNRDQVLEKSFMPSEWTVEMNPGQVESDTLQCMARHGVNRISLGVQSFDDRLLRLLGRVHAANDALRALDLPAGAGVDNISADLMYGIPEQTTQGLAEDIDRLTAPAVTHISAYALSLEPGVRMYDRMRDGYLTLPDDDTVAAMYETIRTRLAAAGFEQYELSNWARPGKRCLHNRIYWEGGDYIGIGPSAHSCRNGARYANTGDIDAYMAAVEEGRSPEAFREVLDPERKARERLMLWLRETEGVPLNAFEQQTGFDAAALIAEHMDNWQRQGWLERTPTHLRLTPAAYFISDSLFREMV